MHELIDQLNSIPPAAIFAIGVFLLLCSTAQIDWRARLLVWAAGAACLVWTGWRSFDAKDGHLSLVRIAQDLVSHGFNGRTILRESLDNFGTVIAAIAPMLDTFLIIAAFLALLTLVALSPGESIERFVRPGLWLLIGAIGGGVFALTLQAIGLGGYVKNSVYAGVISAEDVIDGDTIRINRVSIRLYGVDAPEYRRGSRSNQICGVAGDTPCGALARAALVRIVENQAIVCKAPKTDEDLTLQIVESFGRPLLQCWVHGAEYPRDVGEQLLEAHVAIRFENAKLYQNKISDLKWCALKPAAWRNEIDARVRFREGRVGDIDPNLLTGPCPQAPAPR